MQKHFAAAGAYCQVFQVFMQPSDEGLLRQQVYCVVSCQCAGMRYGTLLVLKCGIPACGIGPYHLLGATRGAVQQQDYICYSLPSVGFPPT
jgi:hypothetical protein